MPRQFVVDACCALNLLATRREVDIARGLALSLLETPQVGREVMTLWTPPDADGLRGKERVSTRALRDAGLLEMRPLDEGPLMDAFVEAAARIKDSDASCIALAGVLGVPLMTDDRKERNVARELFPAIELVSTLDILAEAETALAWSREDLAGVTYNLRWRGNFAPPRADPRGPWYAGLLKR